MPLAQPTTSTERAIARTTPSAELAPVHAPAAGQLPAQQPRSLSPGTATARTGSSTPAVASGTGGAAASRPLVGGAPAIQRLSATVPTTVVPERRSRPAEPDVVPVSRGIQRMPETVPAAVRSDLEPRLGASLADVKVHRGPDATAAARAVNAKAFAAGGAVVLPDEHGSMSSGEGRKILAHELTHVVQQRTLGSALPSEDSAEGQRLESQARAVGGQDPVPARPVASVPRSGSRQRLAAPALPTVARPLNTVPASPATPPHSPTATLASQASIAAVVQQAAHAAGIGSTAAPASDSATAAAATPAQRLPAETGSPASNSAASAVSSSVSSTAASTSTRAAVDAGSAATDVDELARRLYPKFRARLRTDLLLDRERSGRLFDGSGR